MIAKWSMVQPLEFGSQTPQNTLLRNQTSFPN